MLNREGRIFGLLSEEEVELFQNVNMNDLEVYLCGEWKQAFNLDRSHAYRIKLKEGEWYYIHHKESGFKYYIQFDKIVAEFNLRFKQCYDLETCKLDPKEEALTDHFDILQEYEEFRPATPDQIKQLELEEMKHGKKWNGDGYDDGLTADGLTWNELLEHDLSEIENNSSITSNEIWNETTNDKEDFNNECVILNIKHFRLKPQETFVDAPIEWGDIPLCNQPADKSQDIDITNTNIGSVNCGWALQGYLFEGAGQNKVQDRPILFDGNMKNSTPIISSKATHARFVKVGE
jgi:hypothetical protein